MGRLFWLAVAVAGVVVIASGCGSSSSKTPVAGLPLWQRVLGSGDVPGFDAQMQAPSTLNLSQFIDDAKSSFIQITVASARKELTADGFRTATIATYPSGQKNGPLVASTVIWVGSAALAQRVVGWAANDSLQSCRNVCNAAINSFKVSGIPDARGAHRVNNGSAKPFESYDIVYANGPFVYDLFVLGPKPGAVKQDDLIAAAKAQYKRVKGVPLPRFLVRGGGPGSPTRKP